MATPVLVPSILVVPTQKKSKKQMTAYWAISLKNDIFSHEIITKILTDNPQLKHLERIHSTLLYVGKKENENELVFEPHEKREVTLTATHVGHSKKAMALKVQSIKFKDGDETVPSFAEIQHVTLALDGETKPAQSVETLRDGNEEATVVEFAEPVVLDGFVKRYLF
jgi:hypothetical protein